MFAGLDDLWLENASGCFSLEMIPSSQKHENQPMITIILSGTKNTKNSNKNENSISKNSSNNNSSNNLFQDEKNEKNENLKNENIDDAGVSVRLKAEGFRLAGDKGKRIPKLKLESVSVTVSLRVSISLQFDLKTNKVRNMI